jgi:hypothetical protein
MRVAFILGGQLAVELDLQVDPDPHNIEASLVNEIQTAMQQRQELARMGAIYAVTWAADNFGSQDGLDPNDVELGETSSIVIWAARLPRKRVARSVDQVIELPTFEDLLRRLKRPDEGGGKRKRLSDAGDYIAV